MKLVLTIFISAIVSQCCLAQHWDSLPACPSLPARVFYTDTVANKLYVAGAFTQLGNQTMRGIASWNGVQWDSLGVGLDGPPNNGQHNTNAIVRLGSYLYVGGYFFLAGGQWIASLARWDGNLWDSVPGAALAQNKGVLGLTAYNNELYICGTFDTIGNVPVGGIARWDGTTCHPIGNYNFLANGGAVAQMRFYRGNLYVSGHFDDPNGNQAELAKWDGQNWQFFTNEIIVSIGGVADIAVYDDKLFVAGCFYAQDGNAGTSIMTWNDTAWSAVGGSVQLGSINPYPFVRQMCVHNGKLYCVGSFEFIGGISAKGLASWDGTQWCGYDALFTSAAYNFTGAMTMDFLNDTMYVGGNFMLIDSLPVPRIGKWIAGSYVDTCGAITTGISTSENPVQTVSVFPNPASTQATFLLTGFDGNKTLIIYDQLGKEIWRKESEENEIIFPTENLARGMYFFSVNNKIGIVSRGKLLIE